MPRAKPATPRLYRQTDHGPEVFPRRYTFTPEEQQWFQAVASFLPKRLQYVRADQSLPVQIALAESRAIYEIRESAGRGTNEEAQKALHRQLVEILLTLRVVNEILKVQYGSPDWGNQPRVIDELVFILLTRRSKITDAIKHLTSIREKYTTWHDVAFASSAELKETVKGGGLEDDKVKFIQGSLRTIWDKFGRINEADFVTMSDKQLDEFLCELPGVGPKSSTCVLMYTRGADVFPADTHCIRVLNRLGLFASLGLEWDQTNHKQAEKDFLLLIPPHMRGDLHRNLLALGQEICTKNPLCNYCELRKFCSFYRRQQQARQVTLEAPSAIDMFCGAGGFSLGLSRAGFKIVASIDNNLDAIRTYRLNHPEVPDQAVIADDVRQVDLKKLHNLLGDQKLDLLIGGPPCQGFSMMGNRVPHKYENGDKKFGANYDFAGDERNNLFEAMIRVAKSLEPRFVVIENVPGLGSAEIKEKSYADHIGEQLGAAGYQVEVIRLEATQFGVPQRRPRYFIFGVRDDLPPLDLGALNQSISDKDITQLRHALFDLPPLSASDGKWISSHTNIAEKHKRLAAKYLGRFHIRGQTRILFSHVSRYNNEDDMQLFAALDEGESYRKLIERAGKQDFTKYRDDNFPDKYYRLKWDSPSKTIVSHLGKDGNSFIHPRELRSLSVREAARIQSFPDDYIFCGSRKSQFMQIGNAVPPIMAEAIGRLLRDALVRQKSQDGQLPKT